MNLNTNYHDTNGCLVITALAPYPYAALDEEYALWLSLRSYPYLSADELFAELCVDPKDMRPAGLQADIDWLWDFICRYEDIEW